MKIQGELYSTMQAAMLAVIESLGGADSVKAQIAEAGYSHKRAYWTLWSVASRNLQYDDAHPCFANGTWKRIHPHKQGFDIYQNNPTIVDAHIETALKKICKEAGVV